MHLLCKKVFHWHTAYTTDWTQLGANSHLSASDNNMREDSLARLAKLIAWMNERTRNSCLSKHAIVKQMSLFININTKQDKLETDSLNQILNFTMSTNSNPGRSHCAPIVLSKEISALPYKKTIVNALHRRSVQINTYVFWHINAKWSSALQKYSS